MRISGIERFIGGADNVVALEILQGEQRLLRGTLRDSQGAALNITGFTLEAMTEFYRATVSTSRRSTMVSSLDLFETGDPGYDAGSLSAATVAITDAPNGVFTLTFPSNLYEVDVDADMTANVPVCVVYVRYSDGAPGASGTTSRVSRFVLIIRRSKFTS